MVSKYPKSTGRRKKGTIAFKDENDEDISKKYSQISKAIEDKRGQKLKDKTWSQLGEKCVADRDTDRRRHVLRLRMQWPPMSAEGIAQRMNVPIAKIADDIIFLREKMTVEFFAKTDGARAARAVSEIDIIAQRILSEIDSIEVNENNMSGRAAMYGKAISAMQARNNLMLESGMISRPARKIEALGINGVPVGLNINTLSIDERINILSSVNKGEVIDKVNNIGSNSNSGNIVVDAIVNENEPKINKEEACRIISAKSGEAIAERERNILRAIAIQDEIKELTSLERLKREEEVYADGSIIESESQSQVVIAPLPKGFAPSDGIKTSDSISEFSRKMEDADNSAIDI